MSPSPVTVTTDITSPHGIDYAWPGKTGLPLWYGWTINHILGMLEIGSKTDHQDAQQLRARFIQASRFNHLHLIKHLFLMEMFHKWLIPLAQSIPEGSEAYEVLETIATYRQQQEEGGKIHSRDWKNLTKQRIPYARAALEGLKNANSRHCLYYILAAAASAAEEENPVTIATMIREVANAEECAKEIRCNATYRKLAEELLQLIMQQSQHAFTTEAPSPLLEKLGTYTPVQDHVHPDPLIH